MMRALMTLAVLAALAAPAIAHGLVVYAYAESGEVVVEAKFSNDRPASQGEIRVLDAASNELMTLPLQPGGETRFALPEGARDGLVVEVKTSDGHEDYWILTAADLEGAE